MGLLFFAVLIILTPIVFLYVKGVETEEDYLLGKLTLEDIEKFKALYEIRTLGYLIILYLLITLSL